MTRRILCVLAATALAAPAAAQPQLDPFLTPDRQDRPPAAKYVHMRAVPSALTAAPGATFHVALVIDLADGWVYYSPDAGGSVLPASLDVQAGPLTLEEILWPPDHAKAYPDLNETVNVYEHRVVVYVRLAVPQDITADRVEITLIPGGQVCEKVCIPVEGFAPAALVKIGSVEEPNPAWRDVSAGLEDAMPLSALKQLHAAGPAAPARPLLAADYSLWGGLAAAFLAGLILNIMPCVLPIIPVRIYAVVNLAGQSRRRFLTLGLAFAFGILLFFLALAAINAGLNLTLGRAFLWSEQWQNESVRIGMALVLVAVAANLFGLFTVTVPQRVSQLDAAERKGGHLSSVGMGLMMAILSTPCSFGFLLGALAWGQTQTLTVGTLVFVAMGIGMAAPHAMLCALPKLVDKLPKPGRWMELFKQAMGFALLPIAIWLLAASAERTYPFWVAAYAVVLAFCLWVAGRWVRYDAPLAHKLIVRGGAVVLAVAAGWWMLRPTAPLAANFEPFDPAGIEAARADDRIVVLKFTATWCLECKLIDATVYSEEQVADRFKALGVLAMKADVTDRDSPAAKFLKQRFAASPPLTVIYPSGDSEPICLTGVYSTEELFTALDKATDKSRR